MTVAPPSRAGSADQNTAIHALQAVERKRLSWFRRLPLLDTAVSLAVGLIVWEILGRVFEAASLPPASKVMARLWEMVGDGLILNSLGSSLVNLALGFGLSLTLGLVVGGLMGWYHRVESAFSVYVYALLTSPSLVFAPVFFSVFGDGRESIIGVIVMYSTFAIMITTTDSIKAVSPSLVEMARSFGASPTTALFRIVIPAALPGIMAGIRLGASRAVTGMINGEMFIAVVGLGRIVTEAGGRFDATSVLAVIVVIVAVALLVIGLVQFIERRLTSWLPKSERGAA
ncbi:ABC transporter permease [Devosia sp. ZW T5_3]|uniref:ABC transporter permease n=1 Tax=Devosia sp. ZW T5_3 TaxID=3378085 RepID=UPI003853BB0D